MLKEEINVEQDSQQDQENIQIVSKETENLIKKSSLKRLTSEKKEVKVSFKEDVEVHYTMTYHPRKQRILLPEFWVSNSCNP